MHTESGLHNRLSAPLNGSRGSYPPLRTPEFAAGVNGEHLLVPIGELNVDLTYQRPRKLDEALIREMKKAWQWELCNELIVARRADGSLWVLDGNGRLTGARQHPGITHLWCRVVESKGPGFEAELFRLLNTKQKKLNPYYTFRALVQGRDATATAINEMVEARGYKIGQRSAAGVISFPTSLLTCATRDLDTARVSWNLCADIYRGEGVPNEVFLGLFELERHLRRTDRGSLTDLTKRGEGTAVLRLSPRKMLDEIYKIKGAFGASRAALASAQGIINLLNVRRHEQNRIPDILGARAADASA